MDILRLYRSNVSQSFRDTGITLRLNWNIFRNNKLGLMKELYDLDKQVLATFRLWWSLLNVPQSYLEKEFPEYKALFEELQEIANGPIIQAGSQVEGASLCREFKDPLCGADSDAVCVMVRVQRAALGSLIRCSEYPGWYWVDPSVTKEMRRCLDVELKHHRPSLSHVVAEHTLSISGPALTDDTTSYHPDGSITHKFHDSVPVLELTFWPPEANDWLHRARKWPPRSDIDDISQRPCFLVSKPPTPKPEDTDLLYISFTIAEQIICHRRTEGMRLTYFFFKSIYYCCFPYKAGDKEFSSYLAKTTMMWACEELPVTQWSEYNLLENLCFLFKKLMMHIEIRYLPHYFIPELNLLQNLPEVLFTAMEGDLDKRRLLSDPMSYLPGAQVIGDLVYRQHRREIRKLFLTKIGCQIRAVMDWQAPEENAEFVMIENGWSAIGQNAFSTTIEQISTKVPSLLRKECDTDYLMYKVRGWLNGDLLRCNLKKSLNDYHDHYITRRRP